MKYVVSYYELGLAFGGPEEGGWRYDTGNLVRLVQIVRPERTARAMAEWANRLLDRLQRYARPVSRDNLDGPFRRL